MPSEKYKRVPDSNTYLELFLNCIMLCKRYQVLLLLLVVVIAVFTPFLLLLGDTNNEGKGFRLTTSLSKLNEIKTNSGDSVEYYVSKR